LDVDLDEVDAGFLGEKIVKGNRPHRHLGARRRGRSEAVIAAVIAGYVQRRVAAGPRRRGPVKPDLAVGTILDGSGKKPKIPWLGLDSMNASGRPDAARHQQRMEANVGTDIYDHHPGPERALDEGPLAAREPSSAPGDGGDIAIEGVGVKPVATAADRSLADRQAIDRSKNTPDHRRRA
jgi:hypothetical protein